MDNNFQQLGTTKTKTKTISFDKFIIKDIKMELGVKATVLVMIFPVDNNTDDVYVKNILMDGADYEAWGADDGYLVEFVKNKILNE